MQSLFHVHVFIDFARNYNALVQQRQINTLPVHLTGIVITGLQGHIIINHACIAHITFREKSLCALRMKNTEGSKVKMGQVSKQ